MAVAILVRDLRRLGVGALADARANALGGQPLDVGRATDAGRTG